MGCLALGLMLVILPCLTSVHGGGRHNAVVQKISGIEQFVPPPEGCVAWVTLDASNGCTWCQSMFRQILQALIRSYHPIEHFYSPAALVASHKSKHRDMKGTCFVNYLVTNNYKGLSKIFNPTALSKIRTKNWIVFIEGEKTSHFLKCWANTIDANFGFVFPKVVLVMMHQMRTENDGYALTSDLPGTSLEAVNTKNGPAVFGAAVACYMCPEGKSYFVGIQQGDKNPYNLLKKSGDRKGNYGPPGISPETAYFTTREPNSPEGLVIGQNTFKEAILFAAQTHLNFNQDDPKSGVIIKNAYVFGDGTHRPEFRSAPVRETFVYEKAWSLVYCRAEHTNKYVAALVSPIESGAWVLLLVSVLSISLVAGLRVWGGLDLLWLMLGQPPQVKNIGVLIILSSIILFPVPILYKEYYASNAMTPFEIEKMDTNQKVFESEFKYICDDIAYYTEYAEDFAMTHNMHLNLEEVGKYFMSAEELGTHYGDPKILANGRDRCTIDRKRTFKDLVLQREESYAPGTKCYMTEEYWWAYALSIQYTGPLSEALYDTLQMLRQAGILDLWHKVSISPERRKLNNELSQSRGEDDDNNEVDEYESGIIHMNSTLMSISVMYLGFCGLALLCLMAEMMSAKIVRRWKRWRERRRYLRAIWPLGKI